MHAFLVTLVSVLLGGFAHDVAFDRGTQEPPEFWGRIEKAVDDAGVRSEFDSVLQHMAAVDLSRGKDPNRLACVLQALREPWTPPRLAAELRDLLERPAHAKTASPFAGLTAGIAAWLDLEGLEAGEGPSPHAGLRELRGRWDDIANSDLEGLALLESLSTYVELAHFLLEESLAGLEAEDRGRLFGGLGAFLGAWHHNHFPGQELTEEENRGLEDFKTLLVQPKTDRALLLAVAGGLLRLADPEFLGSLPKRLGGLNEHVPKQRFGANVMAAVGDESFNRVLVTGKRGTRHAVACALTIDLGGDDEYARAAVVTGDDLLVSIVIDLAGDDHYGGQDSDRAKTPESVSGPAAAVGGVALLIDHKGNDRYSSGRFGLGASALGFAALIDRRGDDEYTSEDFAQGFNVCGVGLLYDLAGNDKFGAWAFAQGAGIGYGLGALVDGAGNDSYLADLVWPDVYGNSGPDVYHGASQGYSTGIRSDVAGGLAALLDLGPGSDRYQAGSFSQGGGYYFSFGLKFDGGGDDESFGSRYAQGFGVHQAVGVLWDAGGDDLYDCRSVAHAGMAWDEGVGYLLEDSGDDRYQTGDLSCGGAAQTGVAICIDRKGADRYTTGNQSQGGCGSSEYHHKPALGVLFDLGRKRDTYSAEGRADRTVRVTAGVEVFVDR